MLLVTVVRSISCRRCLTCGLHCSHRKLEQAGVNTAIPTRQPLMSHCSREIVQAAACTHTPTPVQGRRPSTPRILHRRSCTCVSSTAAPSITTSSNTRPPCVFADSTAGQVRMIVRRLAGAGQSRTGFRSKFIKCWMMKYRFCEDRWRVAGCSQR